MGHVACCKDASFHLSPYKYDLRLLTKQSIVSQPKLAQVFLGYHPNPYNLRIYHEGCHLFQGARHAAKTHVSKAVSPHADCETYSLLEHKCLGWVATGLFFPTKNQVSFQVKLKPKRVPLFTFSLLFYNWSYRHEV